jgi:hypothetical protein
VKPRSAIGALAAIMLAVAAWTFLAPGQREGDRAVPAGTEQASPQSIDDGAVLKPEDPCARPADEPFVPTSIRIQDVTRSTRVLALPRDRQNVPGVPATSDKTSFAWDAPGIKPGSARGNVLLNAHTWPDGTAMGNRLLRSLQEGGLIELSNGSRHLCYRVTERLEAPVEHPPLRRVYDFTGKPQAVLIVCSGVRRGPGDWSHRTIWFAEPVDAA